MPISKSVRAQLHGTKAPTLQGLAAASNFSLDTAKKSQILRKKKVQDYPNLT